MSLTELNVMSADHKSRVLSLAPTVTISNATVEVIQCNVLTFFVDVILYNSGVDTALSRSCR